MFTISGGKLLANHTIKKGHVVLRRTTPLIKYIKHDPSPNLIVLDRGKIVTNRDVHPGDTMTIDKYLMGMFRVVNGLPF
tara:strand:+ start:518 stop:754 length:237 start_codon:yes stop_codon:yes gene_type:complete